MKKSLFILIAFFGTPALMMATVLTVSNHPLGGSQYPSFDSAYSAAVNGDTLYLEGTNIPYGLTSCVRFDKSLTYVGIGFNAATVANKSTVLTGTNCFATVRLNSPASGSRFYGITFSNGVEFDQDVTNIIFEDCLFTGRLGYNNNTSSGIIVRNCIFNGNNAQNVVIGGGSNSSTLVLTNCVLDGYIEGGSSNLSTVSIDHCVFLRAQSTTGVFVNLQNASISNSIIMNTTTVESGTSTGNSYVNNIAATAAVLPPVGASGSGNLSSTNPNFVNYVLGDFYDPAHDYALQGGSPAIGAGSGGSDIGVHGGTSNFSESGEVLWLPIVRSVIIDNTSVAPNGTINVQVEASRPAVD